MAEPPRPVVPSKARTKRRQLSAEELSIWRQVSSSVQPLVSKDAASEHSEGDVKPVQEAAAVEPPLPVKSATRPHLSPPKIVKPAPESAAPRMDRQRYEKLRRGRIDPEARLDLHGMTADQAHARLSGFIAQGHARGLRLVLVITGKGRAAADDFMGYSGQGVLRRQVPHWLSSHPNRSRILHVAVAHRRHGGEGAFYVYLARRRG